MSPVLEVIVFYHYHYHSYNIIAYRYPPYLYTASNTGGGNEARSRGVQQLLSTYIMLRPGTLIFCTDEESTVRFMNLMTNE